MSSFRDASMSFRTGEHKFNRTILKDLRSKSQLSIEEDYFTWGKLKTHVPTTIQGSNIRERVNFTPCFVT